MTGDNGLLTKVQEAKEENEKASDRDLIAMAITEAQIGNNGYQELDEANFQKALESQFKGRKVEAIANGDGSFNINLDNGNNVYYIDSDSQILDSNDMIAIGTAEELKAFRDEVNSGNSYEGKYVYLTDDITLNINEEWTPIGLYPNDSSTPDNENNKPFKGIFDGKNHEINGIYIDTSDKAQGLFGLIDNGTVKNLGIGENCNISGETVVSGLVGYIYNGSKVTNCYNKADITGRGSSCGGLIGVAYTNCQIINSYNEGNINSLSNTQSSTSGIVAYTDNNIYIINCYNSGIINSNGESVGGIVGNAGRNTSIEKSYNTSEIIGKCEVGGICGNLKLNESKILKCYNSGNITATDKNTSNNSNIGGIVGLNSSANVKSCYNTGAIVGIYNNIGGIVGLNRGILKNSYNIGSINNNVEKNGSITGNNDIFTDTNGITYTGNVENCYSLTGVAEKLIGSNTSTVGEECSFKDSNDLMQLYTILGEAFKQDLEKINQGYPILEWQ